MSYRLRKGRISSKNVRRLCREQIDRALAVASAEQLTPEGVHEVRKVVKRVRAALRLIEPRISSKTFKDCYRGIGRVGDHLAEVRNRHVFENTIAKLESAFGVEAEAALSPLKAHFVPRQAATVAPADPAALLNGLTVLLQNERRKIDAVRLKARGFDVIAPGLEATYSRARRRFAIARRNPSDDNLHELRKTVQWHWRQIALISAAWPAVLDAHIAACRELAELLGDDHDLSELLKAAGTIADLSTPEHGTIRALIARRQDELRGAATPLAARIVSEKPRAFIDRMRNYWRAVGEIAPKPATTPLPLVTAAASRKVAAAPRLVARS